jgi:hypothetical protein
MVQITSKSKKWLRLTFTRISSQKAIKYRKLYGAVFTKMVFLRNL